MNPRSRVFLLDSSDPLPIAYSPANALTKIDLISSHAVNRALNASMGPAHAGVMGVDLPRRAVYVLTDLQASQWQTGQEVEGPAEATKAKKAVDIFIIRVGDKDTRDVAVVSAETIDPVTIQNAAVPLRVKVRSTGPKAVTRTVELWLDDDTFPRDKRSVEIPANSEIDVPSVVIPPITSTGLHRIEIRLVGEPDPLEFDDRRFLTIDVRPALKFLLVSDRAFDADFVANALVPDPSYKTFDVKRCLTSQLDKKARRQVSARFLRDFSAECPCAGRALVGTAQSIRSRGRRIGDFARFLRRCQELQRGRAGPVSAGAAQTDCQSRPARRNAVQLWRCGRGASVVLAESKGASRRSASRADLQDAKSGRG